MIDVYVHSQRAGHKSRGRGLSCTVSYACKRPIGGYTWSHFVNTCHRRDLSRPLYDRLDRRCVDTHLYTSCPPPWPCPCHTSHVICSEDNFKIKVTWVRVRLTSKRHCTWLWAASHRSQAYTVVCTWRFAREHWRAGLWQAVGRGQHLCLSTGLLLLQLTLWLD